MIVFFKRGPGFAIFQSGSRNIDEFVHLRLLCSPTAKALLATILLLGRTMLIPSPCCPHRTSARRTRFILALYSGRSKFDYLPALNVELSHRKDSDQYECLCSLGHRDLTQTTSSVFPVKGIPGRHFPCSHLLIKFKCFRWLFQKTNITPTSLSFRLFSWGLGASRVLTGPISAYPCWTIY